ncbi:glutamate synthase-related protein [Methylobacter svalbardensis]|uniref:glutamate synthase-related protein n=1 Tax=Methylobacter svalbardensis TaxID=3080016 RepID=UPI0030EF191D
MRKTFLISNLAALAIIAMIALFWSPVLWSLLLLMPVLMLGIYDMLQIRHTLWRNFPVFGRIRWLLEGMRPMIRQYFIEEDTDGLPVSRVFRSVVYQRAKGEMDTVPYGTKFDVYRVGYEWIGHSLAAKNLADINSDLRVTIGGCSCRQPYSASLLNISALSFGALSSHAIMALNGGAKLGNFAHNTGEGGISRYHLEHGGGRAFKNGRIESLAYFPQDQPD